MEHTLPYLNCVLAKLLFPQEILFFTDDCDFPNALEKKPP